MPIDSSLSLRAAAALHLAQEGLAPDAGESERWVKVKIGPIPFAYPNTKARKKLVLAHDLHHLLADYRTDLAGEGEMAAWELGSGLQERSAVRYAIRVFGFALAMCPGRLFDAFVRGRYCQNLLGQPLDAATLDRSVEDLRTELGLWNRAPEPSEDDRKAFRGQAAKGIAIVWGPILPLGLLAWWLLR
jgi:hypothetical protein